MPVNRTREGISWAGSEMNGADALCDTLLANSIDVCFANPGTSEMHFVAALDRKPQMRCILGLFEGVVTGAADGYARMADKPAATLLHLGPGLANGLANLHNAKRAGTPIVNIIGDHATDHLQYDAPLTSDIMGLAQPMSHWVKRIHSASDVAPCTAEAIGVAHQAPGKVASLILPADAAWGELPQSPTLKPVAPAVAEQACYQAIRDAAEAIRSGSAVSILLGGQALRGRALAAAGRIAQATGISLLSETSNKRIERGGDRSPVTRLPYAVNDALQTLQGLSHLILIGARAPIAFFSYPDKPSVLTPSSCKLISMATQNQDLSVALEWLADELGIARTAPALRAAPSSIEAPMTGKLTGSAVSRILARLMPEHAIICDESITQGQDFLPASEASLAHDYLQLTGGAIGIGLPLATGAAVACPGRKVISLQADGSAMYTSQALWTQAREGLNCLTIILANRSYATLHGEMISMGITECGRNARRMLDLDTPHLDWTYLAKGMGVPSQRVATAQDFRRALQEALSEQGPYLIEAVI